MAFDFFRRWIPQILATTTFRTRLPALSRRRIVPVADLAHIDLGTLSAAEELLRDRYIAAYLRGGRLVRDGLLPPVATLLLPEDSSVVHCAPDARSRAVLAAARAAGETEVRVTIEHVDAGDS